MVNTQELTDRCEKCGHLSYPLKGELLNDLGGKSYCDKCALDILSQDLYCAEFELRGARLEIGELRRLVDKQNSSQKES